MRHGLRQQMGSDSITHGELSPLLAINSEAFGANSALTERQRWLEKGNNTESRSSLNKNWFGMGNLKKEGKHTESHLHG